MLEREIKPVFCIDTTVNKKNKTVNGTEFVCRTVSDELREELESKRATVETIVDNSELPVWLQIVKLLCGWFFLIGVCSSLSAGFKKAFQNAPVILILSAVCGIVWLVLFFVAKNKEKKAVKEEGLEKEFEEFQKASRRVHGALQVPEDAFSVDLLSFKYKLKNGKVVPWAYGLQTTPFFNFEFKIFATDREICIADTENVYAFSKADLHAIVRVDKRIVLPQWNKDEGYKSETMKPYKISVTNVGFSVKPYYILEVEAFGKCYGVYFPAYEIETMEHITGLTAKCAESR